jgi:hypothetical protein
MSPSRRFLLLLSLTATIAFAPACGGDKSPSTPTGPATGAQPTPTPAATATPAPMNPMYPRSCQGMPPGTGTQRGCTLETANFFRDVEDAVRLAQASTFRDPASGDTLDIAPDGKITSPSAYLQFVNNYLDQRGLCSVYDGEEINVRDGGGYNEHFDIITADGRAWVKYNATCRPALPLPPLPPPPTGSRDPDCTLPPSSSTYCFREPSATYDADVYGAQDDLIEEDRARATPQVFAFADRISGTSYGYRIVNQELYTSGMIRRLKARGFCAAFDGEEFNVKRRTNVLSENFDLTRADGFAIRIYGATCRDAQF